MSFVFDETPCLDPRHLGSECRRLGLPVDGWEGKANVYTCPLRAPGHGRLLVLRKWLDDRDLQQADKFRKLRIHDSLGNTFELKKLLVIGHSNAVTPGAKGDENTAYVLEVADPRWLFWDRGAPITKAYNLRTDTDGSYISSTLNGGSAWTWQQILNDIWPTDLTSTAPTIPFTPDGTPESVWFHNEYPLRAVDWLLTRLACALKYNPFTDTYTIVRLGFASLSDASKVEQFLNELNAFRIWDEYPVTGRLALYPEKIRVQFRVKQPYRDGTQPYYNVDKTVQPTAAAINRGTYVLLEDDLIAQYNGTSITNSTALDNRATERYNDWLRKRQLFDTGEARVYTGAWSMYWTQTQAAVTSSSATGTSATIDQLEALRGGKKKAKNSKPTPPQPVPFDVVGPYWATVIWDERADIRTHLLAGSLAGQDLENWRRHESADAFYRLDDESIVSRVLRTMPSNVPAIDYEITAPCIPCPEPVPGPPIGTPPENKCCYLLTSPCNATRYAWRWSGPPGAPCSNTPPNGVALIEFLREGSHGDYYWLVLMMDRNGVIIDRYTAGDPIYYDESNPFNRFPGPICCESVTKWNVECGATIPPSPACNPECEDSDCSEGGPPMPPPGGGTPPPGGGGGGRSPPGSGRGQSCLERCQKVCADAYGEDDPRYQQCVFDCFNRCNGGGRASTDFAIQIPSEQVTGLTSYPFPTNTITPATIGADQNDYAPGSSLMLRLEASGAPRTITGISMGQTGGQQLYIVNIGTNGIIISDEDAGSAAANRFHLDDPPTTITMNQYDVLALLYDGTSQRWRKMAST